MVELKQGIGRTAEGTNNKIKDDFLDRFNKFGEFNNRIEDVRSIRSKYNQPERKIDDILDVTNDKIKALDQQFKKNGLYLFATEDNYSGTVKRSNIGLAVVNDFSGRLKNSMLKLEDFETNIKMPETALATIDSGFIGKIKAFFRKMPLGTKTQEPARPSFENAEKDLDQYDVICKSVSDYSIEKDLLGSMIKFTNDFKRSEKVMSNIYEGEIKPMLDKMGLSNQIPQYEQVFVPKVNSKFQESNKQIEIETKEL